MTAWRCEAVAFRYPDTATPAIAGVSAEIASGACTGIIGPNGSGKSTLLRLLLGILRPDGGTALFRGRPARDWSRAALAREVGVVPQGEEIVFPLTVRELVAMGRYPHMGAWRREAARDRAAIEEAMERCDLAALQERPISTLSGGERQLARLARALAQQPTALALDEPTVALDIRHEMTIFELLRDLGRRGVTVLLVTHHLNLAARYADRLVLLANGRVAAEGTPDQVLRQETVARIYGWPVEIAPYRGPGPDAGAPQVVPLSRTERGSRGTGDVSG